MIALLGLAGCGDQGGLSIVPTASAQTEQSSKLPPDIATIHQMIQQSPGTGKGGVVVRAQATSTKDTAPKALIRGWNLIVPDFCIGTRLNGYDYLFVYGTDQTYFWTADPTFIALLSSGCASSPYIAFNATSVGSTYAAEWTDAAIYRR